MSTRSQLLFVQRVEQTGETDTENPFDEPAEWTVKVSDHSAFPRWDGPTDEAFKRASWQFHGSLDNALTEPMRWPDAVTVR